MDKTKKAYLPNKPDKPPSGPPPTPPPSKRLRLKIDPEWPEPGVPIGSTIENEKQKQVIKRLVTALEFYADPQYWAKIWGVAAADSERLWVGPGPGGELAQRSLEAIRED